MTFQVSDTALSSRPIRRAALRHGLLSYLFGTGIVRTSGDVDIRVRKPRLFATVLLCAARNGVCYNQTPRPVPATAETRVHVKYGTPDRFEIYVALSTDYKFLEGTTEFPDGPPFERRTHGLVRWLGPVSVSLPSPEKEASS